MIRNKRKYKGGGKVGKIHKVEDEATSKGEASSKNYICGFAYNITYIRKYKPNNKDCLDVFCMHKKDFSINDKEIDSSEKLVAYTI